MKKNKLIIIGYIGIKRCYLNISDREAIQKYIKEEEISETELELSDNITIEHLDFDDEFCAYDIWSLDD
mgnify:CR=1 FL=1